MGENKILKKREICRVFLSDLYSIIIIGFQFSHEKSFQIIIFTINLAIGFLIANFDVKENDWKTNFKTNFKINFKTNFQN